jgi:hypothetical protein
MPLVARADSLSFGELVYAFTPGLSLTLDFFVGVIRYSFRP